MSIVSYQSHKITIIYNVKCAQTSLYNVFGRPWNPLESDFFHDGLGISDTAPLSKHIEAYPDYYNVIFVRNTYARIVSMWSYSKQTALSRPAPDPETPNFFPDFTEWCTAIYEDKDRKSSRWSACIPFSTFVDCFDRLDFIGHQESLSEDVKFIADKYDIKFTPLPRLNHSRYSGPYWPDYYNDETKSMISEMYKEDIEMFDFKFISSCRVNCESD